MRHPSYYDKTGSGFVSQIFDEHFLLEVGQRAHEEWLSMNYDWGGTLIEASYMEYCRSQGEVILKCKRNGFHLHSCYIGKELWPDG